MLGQYLAKLYVDKLMGKKVPAYFDRLTLKGDGLLEGAFKQIVETFQVLETWKVFHIALSNET